MIVRMDDNGRRVTLKLRERLEVRLPESQVSGYIWEYKEGCPVLQLDDSDYAERGLQDSTAWASVPGISRPLRQAGAI